jgi:hypothetical protein
MAAGNITMRHGFMVNYSTNLSDLRARTMRCQLLVQLELMQSVMRPDLFSTETPISCLPGARRAVYTHLLWPDLPGCASHFPTDNRAKALATAFNDNPAKSSRPFDASRCGFVIAEGAGLVTLEELSHAKKRGARIYAEVLGYGLSADAHHMTAPPTNGQGAYLSMTRALKNANRAPKDVAYINAHATSTPLGDRAENQAIRRLMCNDGGVDSKQVRVSSSKGAIGHLLGAAGSVESIFSILALHEVYLLEMRSDLRAFFHRR